MLFIRITYTSQFLSEINPSLAVQMFAEKECLDTTDRFPWNGGIQKSPAPSVRDVRRSLQNVNSTDCHLYLHKAACWSWSKTIGSVDDSSYCDVF